MNKVTTMYINDYDDDIREKLLRLKRGLENRDQYISEISKRKHDFLMKRKDAIKSFLEEKEYYPAQSYDNDRMNETFYCELNSHHIRLYVADYIHFIVTSGAEWLSFKIDLMVNDIDDKFEKVSVVDAREGRLGFYDLNEDLTPEFLDEEIRKLENNVEIFRYRLDTFEEDQLIYKYEDIMGTRLLEILSKVLNETKI